MGAGLLTLAGSLKGLKKAERLSWGNVRGGKVSGGGREGIVGV